MITGAWKVKLGCAAVLGCAMVALWAGDDLPQQFVRPPDSARPGVYWYFMDGNLSREGMTRDLESMKVAGIGRVVFLEVNVGVPRGPVDFLGDAWQALFVHAVHEAERLGIEITLGAGPGWTGSGGPWVRAGQSMQHLVASKVEVEGPGPMQTTLSLPPPRRPFFGDVPKAMRKEWETFHQDVAVLAFPTPANAPAIADSDEKALYYRAPFSSQPGVKPYLEPPVEPAAGSTGSAIDPARIVDLTGKLKPDGTLDWQIPPGKWTVLRFVARNNGASTRPAPQPGIGFECDKFSPAALDAHFEQYVGKLLQKVGLRKPGVGWTMLHMDSWEMGAQNWSPQWREEFQRRRGYDPQPFYPAYLGMVVGSRERTERFLWDLRQTGSELVVQHHAGHLKALGRKHGLQLSIEPYDMNPANDFDLGAVADVPMCEFWSQGFETSFSAHEASSIAHVLGRPVVAAEAFTGEPGEDWRMYPGSLKNQGDWAFATGINRFYYHTFAHKPDEGRPGMVMGPYGVHWDRGQTWWPLVEPYHRYVSRCQAMLQPGRTVADVLYLMPEGAPNIFQPPPSAFAGSRRMPDRRGYNFDGCSAQALIQSAAVRDGRIVFPGGATYRLLVLPDLPAMTPELVAKLESLVKAGAVVVGPPPQRSPSLVRYPDCDDEVARAAARLWGSFGEPGVPTTRSYGKGSVIWSGSINRRPAPAPLAGAHWIWFPEGEPAKSAALGTTWFRREFSVAADQPLISAALEMTADNSFVACLNGIEVGQGDDFHRMNGMDLRPAMKGGVNVLTVRAENVGAGANPAGLIGAVRLRFADGSEQVIATDSQWAASWDGLSSTNARPAMVIGAPEMQPWGKPSPSVAAGLYPGYEVTAAILDRMGLSEDFTCPGPVRYTHRTTPEREIYFVANRSDQTVQTTATFRMSGRTPELWDPRTGRIRKLPEFSIAGGGTTLPLRFEPFESWFIVFPRKDATAGKRPPGTANFSKSVEVATLGGAWDVAFDETMGGPARARFAQLEDWTKSADPGIRYYSGMATYRRSFELTDAQMPTDPSALSLDLGAVQVMARVRVNGLDCGVAWTAPWRVDISPAVRVGTNRLEIEVANLWPNRLIGDAEAAARAGKIYTQTTHRPYKAGQPLLPSGLLGPVRLLSGPP